MTYVVPRPVMTETANSMFCPDFVRVISRRWRGRAEPARPLWPSLCVGPKLCVSAPSGRSIQRTVNPGGHSVADSPEALVTIGKESGALPTLFTRCRRCLPRCANLMMSPTPTLRTDWYETRIVSSCESVTATVRKHQSDGSAPEGGRKSFPTTSPVIFLAMRSPLAPPGPHRVDSLRLGRRSGTPTFSLR